MSLRAMTTDQAKVVKSFVSKHGVESRLKDLDAFRDGLKGDKGVSFMLARAEKVTRGVFNYKDALKAAEAVLAGKPDPTAGEGRTTGPRKQAAAKRGPGRPKKHPKSHPASLVEHRQVIRKALKEHPISGNAPVRLAVTVTPHGMRRAPGIRVTELAA